MSILRMRGGRGLRLGGLRSMFGMGLLFPRVGGWVWGRGGKGVGGGRGEGGGFGLEEDLLCVSS